VGPEGWTGMRAEQVSILTGPVGPVQPLAYSVYAVGIAVSILTGPVGPVQLCAQYDSARLRRRVSILTGPVGPVQRHISVWIDSARRLPFQSSPVP